MVELSIVIPVYNVKDYLQRCIDSVLNQEYKDYEIILVDDGSTDGSGVLCDEIATGNECIRVIHKENGGLSSARNAGIAQVKGKYIMLLDSDDWIEEGSLKQLSTLFYKGYDLIMGRAWSIDDDGNKKSKLPYKMPVGEYLGRSFIKELTGEDVSFCSPFYIYRTDYVINNSLSFLDGILHEDELWMPIALLKADSIFVSDIYFYYHFIRQGSIMHSQNYERSAESTLIVCERLIEEYQQYPKGEIRYLRDRLAMLYMRALPQLSDPKAAIAKFGRSMPLKYSISRKQRVKAFLIVVSPELYCKLVRNLRSYEA
ncbi:MAG: glycosyltransferase family 2 protein [Clostridia bacterium]|nr:glycosyltransferase family 2 protein [Clostridia bacterium]